MFRRKIYDTLLSWKKESDGHTALLIEGARRVGKSTVVEEFGKNEYESYILVDFYTASPETKALNGVRLQATLGNQNPTGLPVGAVRH